MNPPIFLNYRRDDGGCEAIAIRSAIQQEFGDDVVFMDTSSLQAGMLWPNKIRASLEQSEVVIVIIGPDWLRAGSNDWGQRRIDQEDDWVRNELIVALPEKRVIPVLVRGAKIPPPDALPDRIKSLSQRQAIDIRREYWDHDIKLLLAQVRQASHRAVSCARTQLGPYPTNTPEGPDPIGEQKLKKILESDLRKWTKVVAPLPEDPSDTRTEIYREFIFDSFQDSIKFMVQVAQGCDIAMHHPRWENIWKTLRVYLTTWDIGHRISDRDIQLARYFDRAYAEFPGATRARGKMAIRG